MSKVRLAKIQGKGPTAFRQLVEVAKEIDRSGITVAFVHHGEPDFDTPTHIKQAAIEAMGEGYTHYVPNKGIAELREAVAEKLKQENGIETDPDSEVIITNGATLGLWLAIVATIKPGDEVLLPNPCFDAYPNMVRLAGGQAVFLPTVSQDGRFGLDKTEIVKRITPRTKAIIINTPNNPTGTVYTQKELEMIAEVANKHDLIIIVDEAYERLLYDQHAHFSVASFDRDTQHRTITIHSFSKTYAMTGWRLGYSTANREITKVMSHMYQYSARCATAFVQVAGIVALKGSQDCTQEMLGEYTARRELFANGLNGIKGIRCWKPEGAFYVFPDISDLGMSSWDFVIRLLEKEHVLTTPGSIYGPEGEGHLRLSFSKSTDSIEKAIEGIERAVETLNR
jgi:aspartate/methionine/tyrosine aminotransferase